MAQGEVATSAKTKLGVVRPGNEYVTPPLTNSSSAEVAAFQGDVKFNISVKRLGVTLNVPIDLAGMGSQPRTIGNVITLRTSSWPPPGRDPLATQRQPGQPRTVTVGGKPVTLPPTSTSGR